MGAEVLRKDTGTKMGTTPFDIELPYGKDPVPVVFKKDKYQDRPLSVIPDQGGQVAAELDEVPPAPTAAKRPKGGRPAVSRHHSRTPKQPMDEDGVLAPSF
jgi:hypothetical protein